MPSPQTIKPERIKYLTTHQVYNIISQAEDNVRDYAIITLAYYHGLRISEVAELQLSDIDLTQPGRIKTRRVKGGLNASYMLGERSYQAVKNWIKKRGDKPGPLFPSRRSVMEEGEKGISKQYLDELYRGYAKKAGIPIGWRNFHALRHSIAVHMVNRDVPIVRIKDWLGHKNIQSTMIYIDVSNLARDKTAQEIYKDDELDRLDIENGKKGKRDKKDNTSTTKVSKWLKRLEI